MSGKRKVWLILLLCLMCLGIEMPAKEICYAADTREETQKELETESEQQYLDEILKHLDFSKADAFTGQQLPEKYSFSGLVEDLINEYKISFDANGSGQKEHDWLLDIGTYVLDLFFYEIAAARPMFVQMLLLAILFAVTNRVCMTCSGYVSNMSFLVVYGAMMLLLMQSFLLLHQVLQDGMQMVIDFLEALVPAYATTLMLSGNAASAGIFYEMTFGMVLLLESALKLFLVPAIHVFVLLEFVDHLFEEEKLSKLAELIESGIGICIKIAVGSVIGISTVQSFLTTAKDRLSGNMILKSVSMLPGVGNTIGSAGEIVLGCGILIKNSVGVAAVIVLLVVCLLPLVKIFSFTFLYRLIVALLQPVADQRLVECVHGVARGSTLYLKIMVNTMLLFMIVISMVTTSTSFIY
ncbi:hypothetical protein FYJ75_00960 [Roseburia sp. MUC/MUC-530-WT-4D]|uniref:Stage III sporulation protein AE n=1 Tax=Roseburia porci TaxID=2605790 RepID=A0A6L5YMB6_9FIRM|nr:stage III sporulation protein AE [Roseburia porci]MST73604.1 hypothetical protein [Roseburia porci]